MFPNVAYRPTVYRTGVEAIFFSDRIRILQEDYRSLRIPKTANEISFRILYDIFQNSLRIFDELAISTHIPTYLYIHFNYSSKELLMYRGVGSGWAGWAHAHPDFGKIEGGGQWRRAALLLAYPDFQTLLHPCIYILGQ